MMYRSLLTHSMQVSSRKHLASGGLCGVVRAYLSQIRNLNFQAISLQLSISQNASEILRFVFQGSILGCAVIGLHEAEYTSCSMSFVKIQGPFQDRSLPHHIKVFVFIAICIHNPKQCRIIRTVSAPTIHAQKSPFLTIF